VHRQQLQAQVADLGEQAVQGRLVDDGPGDPGLAGLVAGDLQPVEPGRSAAVQDMAEALTLAAPEGWLQVFVDEGAPMAALLGKLAAAPATGRTATAASLPAEYVERLLAAFQRAAVPVPVRRGQDGWAGSGCWRR
jgi:MalT-like TPR region